MKRFLITFFITLALVVGAAGAAPAAHADDIECTLDNGGTACVVDGVSGICSGDENSGPYCRVTGTSDSTSFSDPAAAGTAKGYEPEKSTDSVLAGVMQSIMKLFAWLVGVAALTLDYAVFYTVVKMGDYVNNLSAVGVTWQIMRDIGNIVIIFGFLAIGISIILNTERLGYGKKMLPMLLVAAVFLNFSLFLTEAIIDTGNLFATQFYTQIKGGQLPTAESLSGKGVLDAVEKEGISNKIMGQLGLQTIYTAGRVNTDVFKAGNSLIIGFMGIILFLVTAFVLFSLAFVLIARFVILLFLIIVAPIGFAGLAVPQLKGTADKWWHWLFEQTITAPVLLLCLYIALAIITDAQFLVGFGSKSEANGWTGYVQSATGFDNLPGFGSVMISFLVAMGLLLAVVIISKKMSAFGADKASALAGKLSFGATAFVGRRTVGRVSNFAARAIRSSKLGRSDMGKLFAGIADKGAKASFDVRGIKAGGGLKALGGIDAGEAQKGGYHAREEELIKGRIDYAKTLRQTTKERDDSEKAEGVKKELLEDHNVRMKPLERREREQLVAVRDAPTKELKDQARDALEVTRNEIALEKNEHQTKTSEQDVIIKGNSTAAAQKEYGKSLETFFGADRRWRAPYDWPTVIGSARAEAAHRIIGEANKDASLKKLDEIANALGRQSPAAPSSPPAAAAH